MNDRSLAAVFLVALATSLTAFAQVAGSAVPGVAGAESSLVAHGWSARKSILERVVYNESNEKVGTVSDLVVSRDRSVSYLIVRTGGFGGLIVHDVAIPAVQFDERVSKIVMPGATRDALAAMPQFRYAFASIRRDEFVANAEWDIGRASDQAVDLEERIAAARGDARSGLRQELTGLRHDLETAEHALDELKRAEAARWKDFEKSVAAATARLRKATTAARS